MTTPSVSGRVRPAQRLTLTDDVYESLKTLIMEHAIAPGDRVSIDGLARTLEVSPTPVREALARLESDGLVRKRAMSGYTTTPLLTRAEFEELFEMRLLLEPAAAARAAGHATADDRALLQTEAAAQPAVESGDGYRRHAAFTALDARFHDLVAEVSGSALLRDAIIRLHSHLHLHRLYFPSTTQAGDTAAEHGRIATAVARGDADAAADAMHSHLTAARTRHLPAFTR
ncbi:GntR family transcriptional regulator [Catellatospora sp. TT07R-123]|uniref:GntR family transcriptional regulator n=1 Tax=Catellatospora sp. TT07R-123 TaxID=2733863 RepID=UPI001B0C5EAC|nr:GntR family transcriptional regulator [Catellatospora sp. TT07R-123]GHJ49399.1 GntR family transcriptional regulator [Catellatospora sp. TT07R-123]